MTDVAKVEPDDIWHRVAPETLRRTADLARRVLKAPVAILSSFTPDAQIVHGVHGLDVPASSPPSVWTACRRVFEDGAPLVVRDITGDPSGVTLPAGLTAFAGAPVCLSGGPTIGTLCVMDLHPHDWAPEDVELLAELAQFVASQIEQSVEASPRSDGETADSRSAPVEAAAPETDAATSPRLSTARLSTRILLADDLDLNRKLFADMLGTDGHLVDCVADGAEAVKAAAERRYDLILMDMIMPGMDGITATREIRKLPAPACDVPIVALTAHSFKDQLDSCLSAGMNATLTKPMSLDALTSAVSDWTRKRKAA